MAVLAARATIDQIAAAGESMPLFGAQGRPGQWGALGANAQEGGPLSGTWRSLANGDRINHLERQGNRLWAATDGGGLVAWDLADGSYLQVLAPQDGLASNVVFDVAALPDGTIWAGTERGLSRRRPGETRFTTFTPAELPGMPARVVTAIEPLADGRLWLGFAQEWDPALVDEKTGQVGSFRAGGIALFDPATGTWSQETHAKVVEYFGSTGEQFETIPSENVTDIAVGTDGLVWVGTRQYYRWDPNEFHKVDPSAPPGFWVLAGGGLAAFDGVRWKNWVPSESGTGCYTYHITDLAADAEGRMWAATAGKGLLVMRDGLDTGGCGRGMALYLKARRNVAPGLQSNQVWSVAIDDSGLVWAGNDEGSIDILDHRNTFDDSSISARPWETDDTWQTLAIDDDPNLGSLTVTALWVAGRGVRFAGTKDHQTGDGDGIRSYDPASRRWQSLRTASRGLPSNQITAIGVHPESGVVWFAFRHAGVARLAGQEWRWWRAFVAGRQLGPGPQAVPASAQGTTRIPVDLKTKADFDAAFPATAREARLGDDPTVYRVLRYTAERSGSGPYIDVKPAVVHRLPLGTPVYAVDRGPPSNDATQLVVDDRGRAWVGGRETLWLGADCPADRERLRECWQDGGLGVWDGDSWQVYWQDQLGAGANTIPDQEVWAVAIGVDGRVWVGTGDDGLGALDPATGLWVNYDRANTGAGLGSDGVIDIDVAPATGNVWLAHRSAYGCEPGSDPATCTPVRLGGGVSRFDGQRWRAWSKPEATLRAFGVAGEMSSLRVDERRGLVWAGGFDGDPRTMHWNSGSGVHAVLNWCPLDCRPDGWRSIAWNEDGEVAALELDSAGNLWAGLHRSGNGITPPVAGLRILDVADRWHTYTPANAGLVSNEITALSAAGEEVWVGTLRSGVSIYSPPQPTPTSTASPTATDVPSPTSPGATATPGAATEVPVLATLTAPPEVDARGRAMLPLVVRPR